MRPTSRCSAVDRRTFLRDLAGVGGAALTSAYALPAWAATLRDGGAGGATIAAWRDQIGLQLFTVRDRFPTDYPGTLQAVARIGYREVQTTLTYGEHTPQQIKSYLVAAKLAAPTTHVSPVVGPDFERTLEGHQLIGHRYTTVSFGRRGGGQGGGRGPGGGGAPGGPPAGRPPAQRPAPPPQTLDAVKRTAEQLNQAGLVTKRYGMKVIVHNHTEEFAPLADSPLLPYDVLLAETDPSLVAMELDIGWAAVAGQRALDLFRKAPGRFEVWHVKDVAGLQALDALGTQAERQRAARIVPLGEGDIDYRPIFAAAQQAGMKHFYVEQDTAPQSGDSMAAAGASYRHLHTILG